jgi:hypothetical protein
MILVLPTSISWKTWCVALQLQTPAPLLIPERYDPDDIDDGKPLTEEELQLRMEKTEKYKKMLAAHRYAIFHILCMKLFYHKW